MTEDGYNACNAVHLLWRSGIIKLLLYSLFCALFRRIYDNAIKTCLWRANHQKLFSNYMRYFAHAELFSSRKTLRKNQETSWQNVQHVGNGIMVNAKLHLKKYLLNQILRGNLAFVFDKCLFSTNFFFSKSWNLNQVLGVDTLCWNLQLH